MVFLPILLPDVQISDTKFGDFDAVILRNATVEVTIVPALGRVMQYGFVGKPGVLYAPADRAGAGGDRVGFVPAGENVPNLGPFSVQRLSSGVRLTSPAGKQPAIQISREITLAAFGTTVRFQNRVINVGPGPLTIGTAAFTQVAEPRQVLLPTFRLTSQPNGFTILTGKRLDPKVHVASEGQLTIGRDRAIAYRFGSKSPVGRITAETLNGALTVSGQVLPRAKYAYNDSALGVATSPDPATFAELQLMNPPQRLETRQADDQVVTWTLK